MKTRIPCSVLLLLLAWNLQPVLSQTDSLSYSEKISTSEAILTREDFKRLACENVGDALKNITGVYVRNGQIALRDVAADKVVILLDGQRLNTAQGGGVDVITLPIDIVEKVEVVRGGSSALYGADAVGGVIKITTKSKTSDQGSAVSVNAHSTIASFNTLISGLDLSHRMQNLTTFFTYKRTTSTGDFEYTDPRGGRLKWTNNDQAVHDVFLKGSYALSEGSTMSLSGSYYDAALGAPGLTDQRTPAARMGYNNKSVNGSFEQANLFGDFNLRLQGYLLFFELRYQNPEGLVPQNSKHNNDAYSFEMVQSGKLAENTELSYGYTFRHDKLTSTDIGKKHRNNHAAYGTATVTLKPASFYFDEISLIPALRYDSPSDFTAEWSPKLSVVFKHTGELQFSVKSHITRSYRAPTFNDLYWPKDSYSEGNPNLVPETGINYDGGISLTYPLMGEITLTANYFANKLDNLILWAPGADGLWRPSNISKTDARGIETAVRWKPYQDYIELGVDFTHMTALDKSDSKVTQDKDLIYRPRNKADVTIGFRYIGVELNIQNHYVGKRYTNTANTKWLDSYNVLDGNIGYGFKTLGVNFTTKLELTNLSDLDYTIIEGTPVPGRAYRFTVGIGL